MLSLFKELTEEERKQKRLKEREKLRKKKNKPVGEDGIMFNYQEYDYDCGHTCLDMLGYDGHNMFPGKKGLERKELLTIDKVKNVFLSVDPKFFNIPHMIIVESIYYPEQQHWVVGYKDKIYCPSIGIKPVKEYSRYVWFFDFFEIPLKVDQDKTKE